MAGSAVGGASSVGEVRDPSAFPSISIKLLPVLALEKFHGKDSDQSLRESRHRSIASKVGIAIDRIVIGVVDEVWIGPDNPWRSAESSSWERLANGWARSTIVIGD